MTEHAEVCNPLRTSRGAKLSHWLGPPSLAVHVSGGEPVLGQIPGLGCTEALPRLVTRIQRVRTSGPCRLGTQDVLQSIRLKDCIRPLYAYSCTSCTLALYQGSSTTVYLIPKAVLHVEGEVWTSAQSKTSALPNRVEACQALLALQPRQCAALVP